MAEDGIRRNQIPTDVQRNARVALKAVPIRVIVRQLALRWNLGRFGPQFLKAQDVGAVALDPFAELCRAGTNSVHVPCSDSHIYSRFSLHTKDSSRFRCRIAA